MNRYNTKKCKSCGNATSVLAESTGVIEPFAHGNRLAFRTDDGRTLPAYFLGHDTSALIIPCRGCGAPRIARKVLGRVVQDIKCDGRCESATGHSCECACGGRNHGRRHAA